MKRYKGASQIIPNHIQNHTKNMLFVVMVTKLFALLP